MFSDNHKVIHVLDYASGTADRNGDTIDMGQDNGYDSVAFVVHFATIAATGVNSIKAQSGAQSNMSDAADLTGTSITVADDDDNKVKVLDLHRVAERYVRVVVDKDGSNACAESAIAILYNGQRKESLSQHADTGVERHVSPAEGTA